MINMSPYMYACMKRELGNISLWIFNLFENTCVCVWNIGAKWLFALFIEQFTVAGQLVIEYRLIKSIRLSSLVRYIAYLCVCVCVYVLLSVRKREGVIFVYIYLYICIGDFSRHACWADPLRCIIIMCMYSSVVAFYRVCILD